SRTDQLADLPAAGGLASRFHDRHNRTDDARVHRMTDFLGKRPILAVSPHLDDACMAVGATLAALVEAGQPVVVWTVFAGQPLPPFSSVATAFHTDCALGDDAVSVRRAEDLQALAAIGGKAVHLDFLDAI